MLWGSRTCSTILPGGDLVDGLPPVAHTGAGSICRPRRSEHCPEIRVFDELVVEILLWDFDERLGIERCMYDLDSDKGARRLKYLAQSLSRSKLRIHYAFSNFPMCSNRCFALKHTEPYGSTVRLLNIIMCGGSTFDRRQREDGTWPHV